MLAYNRPIIKSYIYQDEETLFQLFNNTVEEFLIDVTFIINLKSCVNLFETDISNSNSTPLLTGNFVSWCKGIPMIKIGSDIYMIILKLPPQAKLYFTFSFDEDQLISNTHEIKIHKDLNTYESGGRKSTNFILVPKTNNENITSGKLIPDALLEADLAYKLEELKINSQHTDETQSNQPALLTRRDTMFQRKGSALPVKQTISTKSMFYFYQ